MEASRIADVTMVIAPTPPRHGGGVTARARAHATALARLGAALFEEVLWLDGDAGGPAGGRRVRIEDGASDARAGLAAAARVAQGERLLWVGVGDGPDPVLRADVLLALVAWPEHAIVQAVDAAGRALPIAIYRREALLPDRAAAGERGDAAFPPRAVRAGDPAREQVALAALGLDGAPAAIFAWRDEAE